ncbi:PIG-L family deacetylase [Streptomyces sp. NBC_00151]|uniref:PIG-L family deacetylase n=1 Tax=Streptomyces sp. NBC_00151 TaxID=2975669 RepID=UPI002DD8F75F|nr:PIG-L family deacetylase [Streptomyces sp. NBC_00151]WRZ38866.1 PIG-L family deacetylase [Streptomyces sp. NBC_00151]
MEPAGEPAARPSLVQVLAHPDDDLYFINPDLQRTLETGHRVTSVYLTAGEADGRNIDTRDLSRMDGDPDFEGYAEARQQGLRAAYADMVTGDRESEWARDVFMFSTGVTVDRSTLVAAPHVQLVFFGLRMIDPESEFPDDDVLPVQLTELWNGEISAQPTLIAAESPLRRTQEISKDGLLRSLVELLHRARPDQFWTMDPDPWHTDWNEEEGPKSSDHHDHTATAQFALAALERYIGEGGVPPLVDNCVGYGNKHWPSNLTEEGWAEKQRVLHVYTSADGHDCRRRYCGDRQLSDGADIRRYGWSTRARYEGGTDWLHLQADGRLAAYAMLGGQVAVWTERKPGGGSWDGPDLLPGVPGLASSLSVAPDREGGVHLVALRRTPGPGGQVDVEVVRMWRQGHTEAVLPWQSVGNPNERSEDWRRCREVGLPEAVAEPTGRLHVFMRNFGSGISARRETDEGWGGWEDLGGRNMQDCLTAVLKSTGRIELFAANRSGGVHWYQEAVYGPYKVQDGVTSADPDAWRPVGGLTPVQIGRSRMALFYREEDSGEVLCVRQRPDGQWNGRVERLGGHGGTGRIAALRQQTGRQDSIVLARRNARNRLSTAVVATQGQGQTPEWTDHDVLIARPPALALDGAGRVVIAVMGTDARVRVTRQATRDVADGFGPLAVV